MSRVKVNDILSVGLIGISFYILTLALKILEKPGIVAGVIGAISLAISQIVYLWQSKIRRKY